MAARPLIAALMLAAVGAIAPVQAQEPAPQPAAALPNAPIPYNQLNRPPVRAAPVTAAKDAAEAEPETPPEPMKRARANAAILQAIDKVTTETMRFEAQVGKPVRYKNLVFTVRACETAAPDEHAPEATAYVVIDSAPRPRPGRTPLAGRQLFRGWMYASSPGVNPFEHPAYDAWLIACKTAAPSPVKR